MYVEHKALTIFKCGSQWKIMVHCALLDKNELIAILS